MQSVELCARLHLSLTHLASVFVHVRFARIRCADVLPAYPVAGLPALLIYRGGLCVADAIRLSSALPPHFTDAELARMLQAKGVLTVPTGEEWLQRAQQRKGEEDRRRARPPFSHRAAHGLSASDGDGEDD